MTQAWFLELLPLAFLWSPAAYCLAYPRLRRRALAGVDENVEDKLGPITGLVIGLSLVMTVLLWVGAQLAFRHDAIVFGRQILWFGSFGAFHLMWWPLIAPRLQENDSPPRPASSRRVASLAPRVSSDYIPTWWWAVPVALLVAVAAYVAHALLGAQATMLAGRAWSIVGVLCAAGFLAGYGFWARSTATQPQLLGEAPTEALLAEYESYRRFVARGIFALMTACVALFLMLASVLATTQSDSRLGMLGGLLGGLGGGLIGVLGGVFGTLASIRRQRLYRMAGGPGAAREANRIQLARPEPWWQAFAPRFEGAYRPQALDEAILARLARRVRTQLLAGGSPTRNAYEVVEEEQQRLRFRSTSGPAGVAIGLNDVDLTLRDGAVHYRVGMQTWCRYAVILCGAIGGTLLAAYGVLLLVGGPHTEQVTGATHLWVIGAALFWGGAWPWLLVAMHKRSAAGALCRILDEVNVETPGETQEE